MSIDKDFDPTERRIEAMMDQSGFSREQAEIKLGIRVVAGTSEFPRYKSPKHPPHRTGHVRGFYDGEPRMSEEFPDMEPPSEEQASLNATWLAQIRHERGDKVVQRITDKVNERIPIDPDNVAKSEADRERLLTALLRTHFDRKS